MYKKIQYCIANTFFLNKALFNILDYCSNHPTGTLLWAIFGPWGVCLTSLALFPVILHHTVTFGWEWGIITVFSLSPSFWECTIIYFWTGRSRSVSHDFILNRIRLCYISLSLFRPFPPTGTLHVWHVITVLLPCALAYVILKCHNDKHTMEWTPGPKKWSGVIS